jgi:hypothetical protein
VEPVRLEPRRASGGSKNRLHRFIWAIEGERGLYVASVDFPDAGRWGTRFDSTFPDASRKTVRADYDVRETGTTPAIGAKVPSVDTPTLGDVGGDLRRVTTDPKPERRFYETSVADALATHKAFVLAFATPAFCKTQTCGPTLAGPRVMSGVFPRSRVHRERSESASVLFLGSATVSESDTFW